MAGIKNIYKKYFEPFQNKLLKITLTQTCPVAPVGASYKKWHTNYITK